jgi:hypothetical protein
MRGVLMLTIQGTALAQALQEEPLCIENSPERRGEIGCSIVEKKLLPADLKEPVFWHIDRFESDKDAREGLGRRASHSVHMGTGG